MKSSVVIAALLMAGTSITAANAGSFVIGKSDARTCYETARARLSGTSALEACNRAVLAETGPAADRLASFVNRGIVKMSSADLSGAIKDFDVAITMDPQEPEAFLNKGIAMLKRNADAKAARAMLNAALDRHTVKPELAYYALGIAEERLGNVRKAYQAYRQAALLAPTWDDPRRELARFHIIGQS